MPKSGTCLLSQPPGVGVLELPISRDFVATTDSVRGAVWDETGAAAEGGVEVAHPDKVGELEWEGATGEEQERGAEAGMVLAPSFSC
jgi:hypothetical protein